MVAVTIPISGANLLNGYEKAMNRRPLQTKMATCMVGFGMGDFVAQTVAWHKTPHLPDMPRRHLLRTVDYKRVARMGAFGSLVAAPQMHVFFTWLDKVRPLLVFAAATVLRVT